MQFPELPLSLLHRLAGSISRNRELHPARRWPLPPPSTFWSSLTFLVSVQITQSFLRGARPWFNQLDMDGDKTSVFHDVDGSVSNTPAPTSPRTTLAGPAPRLHQRLRTGEAPSAAGAMHRWVGMRGALSGSLSSTRGTSIEPGQRETWASSFERIA